MRLAMLSAIEAIPKAIMVLRVGGGAPVYYGRYDCAWLTMRRTVNESALPS